MRQDDSGLHRPSAQFVCVDCGNEPMIQVNNLQSVTLYCKHCKKEVRYGPGCEPIRPRDTASK